VTILLIAAASARRTVLAETLRTALPGGHAEIISCASFTSARQYRRQAEIVIADLENPTLAVELLRFLEHFPAGVGSIALADDPAPGWVAAAIRAGVNAIISREADKQELRLALEAAEAGMVLLHPTSAGELAAGNFANLILHDEEELEHLTAREREVLRLMSDGLGNKQIAARLGVSEHTVKFHTSSILGKLGVGSRTEAVTEGIRRGLIVL
jgi:two-component system, NarL family, response regulator YdfI